MFHDVGFFNAAIKLNSLITICFSDRSCFAIFMWLLRGVPFRIFFYYFTFLRVLSRAMQQDFFVCTGRLIVQRDFIFCLALASASLLGVGSRGGLYSLCIYDMTVAVFI